MLMKWSFDSCSLHLELQSYVPLFKALSSCKADFECLIDWMVLAVQLTGWFVVL